MDAKLNGFTDITIKYSCSMQTNISYNITSGETVKYSLFRCFIRSEDHDMQVADTCALTQHGQ